MTVPEPPKFAPIKRMVERVDRDTGEIRNEFLDNHGAAFPQQEGRQLAIKLNFVPVGDAKYFVDTRKLSLDLPRDRKIFYIRASHHYMTEDSDEPQTRWATVGRAVLTKNGFVLEFYAIPATLSAVVFFHKKEKSEGDPA